MRKNIYVVYDRVSETFDHFGFFVNDNTAIREFNRACQHPNIFAEDLELYRLDCSFDTNLGYIDNDHSDPIRNVVIARGKRVTNEVQNNL